MDQISLPDNDSQVLLEYPEPDHAGEKDAPRILNPSDYDDGLLRTAIPIMILAYGAALVIAAYTFMTTTETSFMIAICGVYALMYFGVPVLMARVRAGRDVRWHGETPARHEVRVETFGGPIGRGEALLQMVIVPVGVALAFAAFSVFWVLAGG